MKPDSIDLHPAQLLVIRPDYPCSIVPAVVMERSAGYEASCRVGNDTATLIILGTAVLRADVMSRLCTA